MLLCYEFSILTNNFKTMRDRAQVDEPKKREKITAKILRSEADIDKLMFEEAYQIMLILHDGQVRKNNETYSTHLLEACRILIQEFKIVDPKMIQAIFLHDSVEDQQERICKIGSLENSRENALKILSQKFGTEVSEYVDILSKSRIAKTVSRFEKLKRDLDYIGGILGKSETIILKLADLFHNLEDIHTITDVNERIRMSEKYLLTLINLRNVLTFKNIFNNEDVQLNVLCKVVGYINEIEEFLSNGGAIESAE